MSAYLDRLNLIHKKQHHYHRHYYRHLAPHIVALRFPLTERNIRSAAEDILRALHRSTRDIHRSDRDLFPPIQRPASRHLAMAAEAVEAYRPIARDDSAIAGRKCRRFVAEFRFYAPDYSDADDDDAYYNCDAANTNDHYLLLLLLLLRHHLGRFSSALSSSFLLAVLAVVEMKIYTFFRHDIQPPHYHHYRVNRRLSCHCLVDIFDSSSAAAAAAAAEEEEEKEKEKEWDPVHLRDLPLRFLRPPPLPLAPRHHHHRHHHHYYYYHYYRHRFPHYPLVLHYCRRSKNFPNISNFGGSNPDIDNNAPDRSLRTAFVNSPSPPSPPPPPPLQHQRHVTSIDSLFHDYYQFWAIESSEPSS